MHLAAPVITTLLGCIAGTPLIAVPPRGIVPKVPVSTVLVRYDSVVICSLSPATLRVLSSLAQFDLI